MKTLSTLPLILTLLLLNSWSGRADDSPPPVGVGLVATSDQPDPHPDYSWGDSVVAHHILVTSVDAGGPAKRGGLRKDDQIVAIDDRKVAGLRFFEACKLLRGAAGTQVKLTVLRQGHSRVFTLTREALTPH